MPNLNKCLIAGHLGRDAEWTRTANNYPIARCSVGVSTRIKKGAEWVPETEWFKVVLLGERYEKIRDRLTRGAAVFVEGRIQTRTWDDKDGQKRYMTELIVDNLQFLGSGTTHATPHSARATATQPELDTQGEDDDVPF